MALKATHGSHVDRRPTPLQSFPPIPRSDPSGGALPPFDGLEEFEKFERDPAVKSSLRGFD